MQSLDHYMLPCITKKLFGFECMGCGMQRSVSLIIHGEFVSAFYMYPAIYTLLPLALVVISTFFIKFKYSSKIINVLAIVSVVIIITSFIIKNIN